MSSQNSSVFPTELVDLILSNVASLYPKDQYKPAWNGSSYTPAEAEYKAYFSSCSLVCRTWNALVKPYHNRILAIRCSGYAKKRFSYSVSLQEVLNFLESNPYLFKYVRHLRLLPPHRHTQVQDPMLLPQILHRFTALRVVELVNIDLTPESIQKHLCNLDNNDEVRTTSPLKLDHFAVYATPERLLPINAVLFFLSLVSEAESFLLETDPQSTWSVYQKSGRAQMAQWHSMDPSIIPRHDRLRTSSLSIKSRNLPPEVVKYFIWSQTLKNNNLTKLYLQADSTRLRNVAILFTPLHSHLLELTLDLSQFAASSQAGKYNQTLSPSHPRLCLIMPVVSNHCDTRQFQRLPTLAEAYFESSSRRRRHRPNIHNPPQTGHQRNKVHATPTIILTRNRRY
ncbi:hypothetical protein BDY19DRAFT_531393 [Irpex rosettiformis]|uniref:Uncharacterized protein n=1 Tax=Irpex rosettiformis TaxID=378272 RepID=A0ACB8TRJ2_9APHY|nr:hypothetical protein BDY19DRAFT_531393 [Irpex rosettiformis]